MAVQVNNATTGYGPNFCITPDIINGGQKVPSNPERVMTALLQAALNRKSSTVYEASIAGVNPTNVQTVGVPAINDSKIIDGTVPVEAPKKKKGFFGKIGSAFKKVGKFFKKHGWKIALVAGAAAAVVLTGGAAGAAVGKVLSVIGKGALVAGKAVAGGLAKAGAFVKDGIVTIANKVGIQGGNFKEIASNLLSKFGINDPKAYFTDLAKKYGGDFVNRLLSGAGATTNQEEVAVDPFGQTVSVQTQKTGFWSTLWGTVKDTGLSLLNNFISNIGSNVGKAPTIPTTETVRTGTTSVLHEINH
jgi:hypothetical protein